MLPGITYYSHTLNAAVKHRHKQTLCTVTYKTQNKQAVLISLISCTQDIGIHIELKFLFVFSLLDGSGLSVAYVEVLQFGAYCICIYQACINFLISATFVFHSHLHLNAAATHSQAARLSTHHLVHHVTHVDSTIAVISSTKKVFWMVFWSMAIPDKTLISAGIT